MNQANENSDQPKSNGDAFHSAAMPKIIRFEELVVCGDEVWIQFQGQLYRLRRTKHDKLILTK